MTDAVETKMPPDVLTDYRFGMQFFGDAKRIIGPHLLDPAPMLLDVKEATDLLVIGARDKRIAYRVRRDSSINDKWRHEVTIRSSRRSRTGAPISTELEKILQGHADWMFYGWGDEDTHRLTTWHLIDLDVFRNLCAADRYTAQRIRQPISNPDGMTAFVALDLRDLPRDLIIDSSIPELLNRAPRMAEINASISGGK